MFLIIQIFIRCNRYSIWISDSDFWNYLFGIILILLLQRDERMMDSYPMFSITFRNRRT